MESGTRVVVIDNWGPPELVRAADATWPALDWEHWHKYQDAHALKYGTTPAPRLPPASRQLIERLSVIDLHSRGFDVDAFPDLSLHGAGLHCIPEGGFLSRHLDGERHPLKGWRREINAVLFVNPWRQEWGGRLYFDDQAIEPAFNRLVLFQTTGNAYHGVEAVAGPIDRRTISLFWWSLNEPGTDRETAQFT